MKKKFILCGIIGWCMEILFTGLHSLLVKDYTLAGKTSIWMFPIYGMACVFSPLSCGIIGWCMEILFTGLHSLLVKDYTLAGKTSIWMFPIYGMACVFSPLSQKLKTKSTFLRGSIYTAFIFAGEFLSGLSIYTAFIFAGEFLSGLFLKKHRICPWDYSRAKFNIKGVIRLDYAPLWFTAGLFFEKFLKKF